MLRLLTISAAMFIAADAYSQTEVGGEITSNTVWSGGTYYVSRDVTVTGGAVLTINEGAIVEFGYDDSIFVRDGGHVSADNAVFRPRSTPGSSAAFYVHEISSSGSIRITNSTFRHVFVYISGNGSCEFEANRFEDEAHLRLFSRSGVRVHRNTFISTRPIHTEIQLPESDFSGNSFPAGSEIYHPYAQRVTRDASMRTYEGLPVRINNDISVTAGATLVLADGLEIRHGYFNAFIVSGRGILKARRVHFRPASSSGNFPAIIVSSGDGAGRAEISESTIESVSLQFSGGGGSVSHTNFLVDRGRAALTNTGAEPIEARNNFWNGAEGPLHLQNPFGDGAVVNGQVLFAPWLSAPADRVPTGLENSRVAASSSSDLESVFPNPVFHSARVRFRLIETRSVEFRLYDSIGHLVRTFDLGFEPAGSHEFILRSDHLAVGVYFLQMEAGETSNWHKLVVAR